MEKSLKEFILLYFDEKVLISLSFNVVTIFFSSIYQKSGLGLMISKEENIIEFIKGLLFINLITDVMLFVIFYKILSY